MPSRKPPPSRRRIIPGLLPAVFAIATLFMPTPPGSTIGGALAASTGKTGLPLPRFVSLKSKRVNMRVGPGREFQVVWMYLKPGLPMEIIQEYGNWRKVRDPEGAEGWILHSLLSGKRTAIVNPWEEDKLAGMVEVRDGEPGQDRIVAKLEPGVVADVEACGETTCRITISNINGTVSKNVIWGVYPDEKIEN